jgi:hypothetical protein
VAGTTEIPSLRREKEERDAVASLIGVARSVIWVARIGSQIKPGAERREERI